MRENSKKHGVVKIGKMVAVINTIKSMRFVYCIISLFVLVTCWLAYQMRSPTQCHCAAIPARAFIEESYQKWPSPNGFETPLISSKAPLTSRKAIAEKRSDKAEFVNKKLKYEIAPLVARTQYVKGPMQDDELLLMFALVRVIGPRTILEFGFHMGVSSGNWLRASSDPDLVLYAWDIAQRSKNIAKKMSESDKRLIFTHAPQEDFDPEILGGRNIDIAFLDAGHTFKSQKALWKVLEPTLSANSLVIIHDTGRKVFDIETAQSKKSVNVPIYTPESCRSWNIALNHSNRCSCRCEGVADQVGYCCSRTTKEEERVFVKYVYDNFPVWRPIYLQSFRFWRHGVTILQQGRLGLPTEIYTSDLNIF